MFSEPMLLAGCHHLSAPKRTARNHLCKTKVSDRTQLWLESGYCWAQKQPPLGLGKVKYNTLLRSLYQVYLFNSIKANN